MLAFISLDKIMQCSCDLAGGVSCGWVLTITLELYLCFQILWFRYCCRGARSSDGSRAKSPIGDAL
jgi:hypothetical protein